MTREAYSVHTADGRTFIMESSDPAELRKNFPVPGEDIRIVSIKPVIVRENLLTVHQLQEALSREGLPGPHWQTLSRWAKSGMIPCRRVGRKYLRFVEADVRAAMEEKP